MGVYNGNHKAQTIRAKDGDDMIFARGGDDIVYGNGGHDRIWGGDGGDHIFGGDGNDQIFGEENNGAFSGDDRIFGEGGDDLIVGERGRDYLNGGDGADRLNGGPGDDTLAGGAGGDVFSFSFYNGEAPGSDVIEDFVSGSDLIDLWMFGISGAQVTINTIGTDTLVAVDTNSDGLGDFTIKLMNASATRGDFLFA